MAKHKFDGDWRYAEVDFAHFPPGKPNKPTRLGKMEIRIPNDATGVLDPSSNHDGANLTGNATADTITMHEIAADHDTVYEGHLITPEAAGHQVIVGSFTRKNLPLALKQAVPFSQDEGIWVITKP